MGAKWQSLNIKESESLDINEDYSKYPRTLKNDIKLLKNLVKDKGYSEKKLVIFAPASIEDIYHGRAIASGA